MNNLRRFKTKTDNPDVLAAANEIIREKDLSRADLMILYLAYGLIDAAASDPARYEAELSKRIPSLSANRQDG